MEYFISHIGIIFIAAAFVAVCAVVWWLLTEKNARLIKERKEARLRAAERDAAAKEADSGKDI